MNEEKPDYGFDYEAFFAARKLNKELKSPRQEAKDSLFQSYTSTYQKIGYDFDFDVEAPHEMFSQGLEFQDTRWEMVDALRGQKFGDSTQNLRISMRQGRYIITNKHAGVELSVFYDTTSPQKFVTQILPLRAGENEPNMWQLDIGRRVAAGKPAGHMDSLGRIQFEQANADYWNGFVARALNTHLGSFASERQSIMAA